MPTWRADYFHNPKDEAPSRSEIIVAENESDRSMKRGARWVRSVRAPR